LRTTPDSDEKGFIFSSLAISALHFLATSSGSFNLAIFADNSLISLSSSCPNSFLIFFNCSFRYRSLFALAILS
jgi:hypothetical protein